MQTPKKTHFEGFFFCDFGSEDPDTPVNGRSARKYSP